MLGYQGKEIANRDSKDSQIIDVCMPRLSRCRIRMVSLYRHWNNSYLAYHSHSLIHLFMKEVEEEMM